MRTGEQSGIECGCQAEVWTCVLVNPVCMYLSTSEFVPVCTHTYICTYLCVHVLSCLSVCIYLRVDRVSPQTYP